MNCTSCEQDKPIEAFDSFVLRTNGKTYTRRQCRHCRGEKTKAYLAKQREAQREDKVVAKIPSLLLVEPIELRLQVATEILAILRRPRRAGGGHLRMQATLPISAAVPQ